MILKGKMGSENYSIWQDIAKEKFEAISKSIPQAWKLSSVPSIQEKRDVTGSVITASLSQQERMITETDAVEIVAKTSTGQWKAEDVVTAFCHRASLAHQLVSCVSRPFLSYPDCIRDELLA